VSSLNSHLRDERRAQLAALLDASGTVLRLAAPVVDLLVRLSLSKAFFAPGMLPSNHLVEFVQTGWPTIIVQVAGPVLLAAGLWVRPVALLMLVLTLLAHTSGPPQDEHLFWAALFGWYMAQGAGSRRRKPTLVGFKENQRINPMQSKSPRQRVSHRRLRCMLVQPCIRGLWPDCSMSA
jgi:uncharacterized membrane protein YphA (DoxX/SURF4 family)